jgi:predicted nucleic acid-binding protein
MPGSDSSARCVICDASPLIFLAKVDALALLQTLIPGRWVVLQCVVNEILGERAAPLEAERLRRWLAEVEVIDFEGSLFPSQALSRSDQSSLAWAVKNQADWLIADDRLLRRFAKEHHLGVIGFCGVLVKSVDHRLLDAREAREMIDQAVDRHGLMISVSVYRLIMDVLGGR